MRRDYDQFVAREAEVLIIGPDSPRAFQIAWERGGFPFPGLADPEHKVAELYQQQVNLLKLGRMPAVIVVDKTGAIRYEHYGESMADIPLDREILAVLDKLNQEAEKRPRARAAVAKD